MKKRFKKILSFPKNYLEWARFKLGEQKAKYKFRAWMDAILASAYTFISIYLIWIQEADLVVLGLNILCLFRAVINNTICASEVTNKLGTPDLEKKHEKNSHYHIKALVFAIFLVLSTIVWLVLCYEQNDSTLLIKIFAVLALLCVLLNDLENIFVGAYNASIEP